MSANYVPNLAALRAFEAVVRHEGLAGAAQELSVTPSAISHRLRQLEQDLGIELFRMNGRRLSLTPAGQELVYPLTQGFDTILRAVARARQVESNRPLVISMLHNIAVNWFLPRLPRFTALHPEIDVQLLLTSEFLDFSQDTADMAIRYCPTPWPDVYNELLIEDQLTPLCSPELLERHGPFNSPAMLAELPLIASSTRLTDDWHMWLRKVGLDNLRSHRRRVIVDSTHLAMQAAANGLGVAIAGLALAEPMLSRRTLIAPFTETVAERGKYYIVCPPNSHNRDKIREMRRWLRSEVTGAPAERKIRKGTIN
ncbi:LysR substrate-binding domain-containing protein [Oceaniovalibus sp. ACAM 378]|uniref:LysR substrate-binding domain-containing protein n=1 Tax=Oceaniovalibus sp. ACAM 378 TaxID=2599923 RepID=UPI0011D3CEDD|nr:LysR substrate-binding domain-containing protein [Oceaniovalibus sp. ACAM 378]TYB84547.1 LysR family transcriptional regulator [Oceaniovalibus sp. ACAM 378]